VHILLALLTIAAASDLQPVLPRLVAAFERETGHTVRTAFGSSGNFYAQIANGAPYDLFLSADASYPKQLETAGLTEAGTLTTYATGSIVVWTRTTSGIAVQSGLGSLVNPRVRRIAIANPAHAPYGRAAVAALKEAGIYDRITNSLVLGENVAQTAQFVQSGGADVGILALSLVRSPPMRGKGRHFEIPSALRQGGVVMTRSKNAGPAETFRAFLSGPEARAILARHGLASK